MPRIYKSGKEFKGNKNSGDKPDSVKFAEFVNMGYANYVVNDELKDLAEKSIKDRDYKKVKDIAVEIAKRGIVEEKKLSGSVELKQITGIRIITDGIGLQDKNTETN